MSDDNSTEVTASLIMSGTTVAIAIIAALVAFCRKQQNTANKNDDNLSKDEVFIKGSEHITKTVTFPCGRIETTVTVSAPEVRLCTQDNNHNNIDADNIVTGYDENPIKTQPVPSITTAAAAATTTNIVKPDGTQQATTNTVAAITRPPAVDSKLLTIPSTSVASEVGVHEIIIRDPNGNSLLEVRGITSSDRKGQERLITTKSSYNSSTDHQIIEVNDDSEEHDPLLPHAHLAVGGSSVIASATNTSSSVEANNITETAHLLGSSSLHNATTDA